MYRTGETIYGEVLNDLIALWKHEEINERRGVPWYICMCIVGNQQVKRDSTEEESNYRKHEGWFIMTLLLKSENVVEPKHPE